MVSRWRLGDVAEIIMGQSPPGETYNEREDGLPFFQGVADFNYRHPSPRIFCTHPSRIAHPGDILLSVRAPIGRVNVADRECAIGRGLSIIRPRNRKDARFIEFALRYLEPYWHAVEGGGSVFGNATKSDLEELPIPWLENENDRRAIAHILGTLDDKIELNRRMNETLEQMARAIFKSWFVDFDLIIENALRAGNPIPNVFAEKAARRRELLSRAESEGRDTIFPKHIADLFPDRFVDSELGPIPAGWRAGRINDILGDLVSGARPKGGAIEDGVPSIGAENVIGLGKYDFSKEKYVPKEFYEQLRSRGADVRPGDVLIYKDGAQIGRKTYVDCWFPHEHCAVNEHVFILRAKEIGMRRYVFFWLDQEWMTAEIIGLNSNSAQPGINQKGVRQLPILLPGQEIIATYDSLIVPMLSRLFTNCHESRALTALRDSLLPKLMSGEIRLADADRFFVERGS